MTLWEKRERARNDDLFPAPAEGATVLETPPCFSWLPAPGEGSYTVVVKNRNGEVLRGECDENCFVPEKPLPPGDYTWDVIRGDSHRGETRFTVSPDAPERDLVCLVRASRFGSDSHRHPDQGGFALFCGGVSLLSPSGYFGRRYGTKHHREWTNTSRAHNVPLFGGVGQYENDYRAVGSILSTEEDGETLRATVFAGGAYPVSVGWTRRFTLVEGALTVTDEFSQDEPREITLCLHTLSRPAPDGNGFRLTRRGVTLICRPTEGIDAPPEITDAFAVDVNEGEPAEYAVSMPEQYHVFFRLPADRRRASMTFFVSGEPEKP